MSSSKEGLLTACVGEGTQTEVVLTGVAECMLVVAAGSVTTVEVTAATALVLAVLTGTNEEEACWTIDVAAANTLDLMVSTGATTGNDITAVAEDLAVSTGATTVVDIP